MRTIKKYASSLPVIALCLLVLGSAAAFAQKKFMMLHAARPVVKVMLAGAVERDDAKVPVEQASLVKSGEVMNWTITSVNEGNAPANEYKAVGKVPAGTQFVAAAPARKDPRLSLTASTTARRFRLHQLLTNDRPTAQSRKYRRRLRCTSRFVTPGHTARPGRKG